MALPQSPRLLGPLLLPVWRTRPSRAFLSRGFPPHYSKLLLRGFYQSSAAFFTKNLTLTLRVNQAGLFFKRRQGGHLAVVERLLQKKADVNAAAAYDHGRTALQAAAGGGHLAVIEWLLLGKATVDEGAIRAAKDYGHRYQAVVARLRAARGS